MTKFDTLSKLTNEELTFIFHTCQSKIDEIDEEAEKLEKMASSDEVEKRFEDLAHWYDSVLDIQTAAEEVLKSRTSRFANVFNQMGM